MAGTCVFCAFLRCSAVYDTSTYIQYACVPQTLPALSCIKIRCVLKKTFNCPSTRSSIKKSLRPEKALIVGVTRAVSSITPVFRYAPKNGNRRGPSNWFSLRRHVLRVHRVRRVNEQREWSSLVHRILVIHQKVTPVNRPDQILMLIGLADGQFHCKY